MIFDRLTQRIGSSKKIKIFLAFLLIALLFLLQKLYTIVTMPAPLVYLIPENYRGPVFVLFGQEHGIETQADPLGRAVTIPENGIVLLKEKVDDLIGEDSKGNRNIYWVSIAKNGARKILKINENTQQDGNGNFYSLYYDESGRSHTHPRPAKSSSFYYFSEQQRNETMIFGHDGCQHQFPSPHNGSTAQAPECGKFLVTSPNEFLYMPDWMWDGTRHPYASIRALEAEAAERVAKKKNGNIERQFRRPDGSEDPLGMSAVIPMPREQALYVISIVNAMHRVIEKRTTLTQEEVLFGEGEFFWPKDPKKPIKASKSYWRENFRLRDISLTFRRKHESSDWHSAGLSVLPVNFPVGIYSMDFPRGFLSEFVLERSFLEKRPLQSIKQVNVFEFRHKDLSNKMKLHVESRQDVSDLNDGYPKSFHFLVIERETD